MAAYKKRVSRSMFDFMHFHLKMIRRSKSSVSTLSKFSSTKESDSFWLRRLDHKDWLSPNEILKVFTNLRDPELIISAFGKASTRMDYKPNEALYSLLIDRLAYAHKFASIEDVLEKAKQDKCRLSDEFFYRLIKIYGNMEQNLEKAITTLHKMPEFHCWPTIKTFNCVLNMLVCNKHFEVIHEVFSSAPRLGITLDTCCFNILMKGLCKWDKLDHAFSLLNEIPKHGRRPNATTYSTLMHSLCNNGRVNEAIELCEKMEKDRCYPDTITFNVLISGLSKQGRVSEGMDFLKVMKLKGCYPNSGTYQALLYGFLDTKRFVGAKSFMGVMVSEGYCPSFLSYKRTIEGLCSVNLLEDVDLVLKEMLHQGFVPRMGTWRKIIGCMFQDSGSYSLGSYLELIESAD